MRRTTAVTAFVILLGLTAVVGWSAMREANRLTTAEERVSALEARVDELEGRTAEQLADVQRRLDALQTRPVPSSGEEATVSLPLYYIRTTQSGTDYEVVSVDHAVPRRDSLAGQIRAAFSALMSGPTPSETEAHGGNLANLIPPETSLNEVRLDGTTAILDLNRQFERVGGTARIDGMLKQITYTVTAFDGVDAVQIFIEGRRVGTTEHPFTGDGFLFDELRRDRPLISP